METVIAIFCIHMPFFYTQSDASRLGAEAAMNKWLAQIEGMLTSATAGMTEEQLVWHAEGKWSTADILEHLAKTYTGTVRGFEKALAANRSLATRATAWQFFAR